MILSKFVPHETDLPPYPDGWDPWLERLLGLLDLSEHQVPVFYVSEEEYAQELHSRGYQAHFSPRKFGISATLIRENPEKYRDYIAPTFVDFLLSRNNVLIQKNA